jgi:hypothetical protein
MTAFALPIDKAKSYATFARANSQAVSVLSDYAPRHDWNDRLTYLIATRADGRFVPVVILRETQTYLMRQLIDRGMYVTN